ncbi:MAG: transporter [Microbacteriaceae bacterium]|nr:transporter [Microbacteriaceae bacterium]
MLVVLAAQLGISLAAAIQLATVYALFYGAGQPLWGILSDRLGRVTVMKIALVGAIVGSIASIAIPGYWPLLVSRALTGLMVGALYPMLITIVADTIEGPARYREISNLQTVSALGTTGATLVAGALAAWLDWRAVFAITILTATVALVPLVRLPNSRPDHLAGRWKAALQPWPLWLYFVAIVEGAVLLGILTYMVPAMEHSGTPVALAGLLAAGYGVGIVVGSQTVKVVAKRIERPVILVIGGVFLIGAYVLATISPTAAALTVTSLLVGLSNSFLHSTLQGWVAAVSPTARATTISFFATCLFLGAGLATGVTAQLAANGGYRSIFAGTAVLAAVLLGMAGLSFRRWLRTHTLG